MKAVLISFFVRSMKALEFFYIIFACLESQASLWCDSFLVFVTEGK